MDSTALGRPLKWRISPSKLSLSYYDSTMNATLSCPPCLFEVPCRADIRGHRELNLEKSASGLPYKNRVEKDITLTHYFTERAFYIFLDTFCWVVLCLAKNGTRECPVDLSSQSAHKILSIG